MTDRPHITNDASADYEIKLAEWARRRLMVVEMRDVHRLSFAEIGRELGITRERARQLYHVGKEVKEE